MQVQGPVFCKAERVLYYTPRLSRLLPILLKKVSPRHYCSAIRCNIVRSARLYLFTENCFLGAEEVDMHYTDMFKKLGTGRFAASTQLC